MPRPRQVTTGKSVEIRCYISAEDAAKFREHFPERTAFSWVMQTAVKQVLAMVDGTPTTTDLVRSAMQDAVIAQRLKRKQSQPTANDNTTAVAAVPTVLVEPID
jgi:hypothetical protein